MALGDGDWSRLGRQLAGADPAGWPPALKAAARMGRLGEALATWAAARPPPGQAPVDPELVELLFELGHGWGDPRLAGEEGQGPRVLTWADDPTGATRLVVFDDLRWGRVDPATGGLVPVDLPATGLPWGLGRGSDDVDVDAFLLAPGAGRALLAVTFTQAPMLDAETFAGLVVVDLAAGAVVEAHPPREDFLFHAASPDLTGMVVGLFHQARLRRVGRDEEVPLPLAGRFLEAWPGPAPDEVTVWWRPEEGRGRLDRVEVGGGTLRGPGLELGPEQVELVAHPGADTWVVWSSVPGNSGGTRLRWVDVATGAIRRDLRARVPATAPVAVDGAGQLAGYPGELHRVRGFRVVGRYPSRGPATPGDPVPIPQGPTLQEIDALSGALLRGPEAFRTLVWSVAVQPGPGGPWLLAHGGAPGELRGRALEGPGRSALEVRGGPYALDRPRLVALPVARRGLGWRADLVDPRTGHRRPVRWRGRGGQTCTTGDVAGDGTVAMGTTYAQLAVGRPDDAEPRWTLPRQDRRHSPTMRWVGEDLVVLFLNPGLEGELVWLAGEDGRPRAHHPLSGVGLAPRGIQSAPGDAYLVVRCGSTWVVPADRGAPVQVPVEEVAATCPLDGERLLVIDGEGRRRVFFRDGSPGPVAPGEPGARDACLLPGGRLAVATGGWIAFEDLGWAR